MTATIFTVCDYIKKMCRRVLRMKSDVRSDIENVNGSLSYMLKFEAHIKERKLRKNHFLRYTIAKTSATFSRPLIYRTSWGKENCTVNRNALLIEFSITLVYAYTNFGEQKKGPINRSTVKRSPMNLGLTINILFVSKQQPIIHEYLPFSQVQTSWKRITNPN